MWFVLRPCLCLYVTAFAGCLPHRILSHASERTSLSLSLGCLSRIEQKRTLETVSVGWLVGWFTLSGLLWISLWVNRFCRFLSLDYQLVCVFCWLFHNFITFSFSVIFVCSIFDIDIAVCVCDFFCYCYTFSRVCIYNCIVTYLFSGFSTCLLSHTYYWLRVMTPYSVMVKNY